jgi:hypothetical protein
LIPSTGFAPQALAVARKHPHKTKSRHPRLGGMALPSTEDHDASEGIAIMHFEV